MYAFTMSDWLTTRPIAHRGLHRGPQVPENSAAAFAAALAANHPIELDVRLLADGDVAVFHDATLQRMTGQAGTIAEQTTATLPLLRLGGGDQPIPLLAEVLHQVAGQVPLLIELKTEGPVGPLEAAVLRTLQGYQGDWAVQSFNPFALAWFKHHAPTVRRGQLAGTFADGALPWPQALLLSNLLLNWASAPHFVAYDVRALPHPAPFLARHLGGRPLLAWTVKTPQQQQRASTWADNYIFDDYTFKPDRTW